MTANHGADCGTRSGCCGSCGGRGSDDSHPDDEAVDRFAPFLIGKPPAAGGYLGVSWRANGEANSYHLLRGGRWLAHILMNGELFVGQQTDMMERIVVALGIPAENGRPAETALRQVSAVIQRYMVPNGISKHDAMTEIIAIMDVVPMLCNRPEAESGPQ